MTTCVMSLAGFGPANLNSLANQGAVPSTVPGTFVLPSGLATKVVDSGDGQYGECPGTAPSGTVGAFLCSSSSQTAPSAYSTGVAIALFAKGGYFQPAAVAGTVAGGTNIGKYHLVCNLTAAGHPLNGWVIDDGGDVYDTTYVAAYVGYWGTPVGLYPIYS